MSDLQCPARFVLLTEPDSAELQRLRHERVAAVYVGPPARGVDEGTSRAAGAAAVADALGLPVYVLTRSLTAPEVLGREPATLEALRDLADLHRGETVLVVVAGEAGLRVEVSVDGDGVTVGEVSRGAAT